MNIYILNYNNYYNRIVKKEETISDYSPYIILSLGGVNFIPNDGINTTQIINCNGVLSADYFIAEDEDGGFTRWFILENERIRNGQYKLTLRRDLMADYYKPIVKSPCFIERGTVDVNSPFIFNSEGQSYNQIKTSETLLKDKSGCPWLVGYMARYNNTEDQPTKTSASGVIEVTSFADYVVNGPLKDFEYYEFLNKQLSCCKKEKIDINYLSIDNQKRDITGNITLNTYSNTISVLSQINNLKATKNILSSDLEVLKSFKTNLLNYMYAWKPEFQSYSEYSTLRNKLNNKIVEYKDGEVVKRVKLEFGPIQYGYRSRFDIDSTSGALVNTVQDMINKVKITGDVTKGDTYVTFDEVFKYTIKTIDYTYNSNTTKVSYKIPADRTSCTDAPYDIFAIPYGELTVKNITTSSASKYNITCSKDALQNVMVGIATQNPGIVYDIQILPYCPIQNIITDDGEIDLLSLPSNAYSVISLGDTINPSKTIGVMLFPPNSSFTFDIKNSDTNIPVTEPKIQSECDMYRLCSPNFGATFEFNAAKNGGVDSFNVDCTYMPYNPYIHLNPNFGQLYGKDFNDARGLICSGEFSLPKLDDAWAQYQLNNKNYQASFDRQIQNMEIKRKWSKIQNTIGATLGAVTGAGAGAMMGGMLGGPAGAIAGGVLGGAGSAASGIADIHIQDALAKEDINMQKDMFEYQLGNIQALPQSLSRTTAFTNNNKYFPVLEYYTCTDEEKEALRQKIKYRGMSVNIISTIENFIQGERTYIKGKIIRIDDISEDFNLFTQIMFEIDKGIYI